MAWCSMRRPLFHSICILCSLFQQLSCEGHTGMASPGSQEKKMSRWPKQTPAESFQIFSLILHLPVLLTLVQTRATKAGRLED